MIAAKIKGLFWNSAAWAVIILLMWLWAEGRADDVRLWAEAECRRQMAEKAQESVVKENKRIKKDVQQKLEILSKNDVGFDTLLELMRAGEL